jgi:hypothetical protein
MYSALQSIILISIFKCEETLISKSNGLTGDLVCALTCKHFFHYSIFKCKETLISNSNGLLEALYAFCPVNISLTIEFAM